MFVNPVPKISGFGIVEVTPGVTVAVLCDSDETAFAANVGAGVTFGVPLKRMVFPTRDCFRGSYFSTCEACSASETFGGAGGFSNSFPAPFVVTSL